MLMIVPANHSSQVCTLLVKSIDIPSAIYGGQQAHVRAEPGVLQQCAQPGAYSAAGTSFRGVPKGMRAYNSSWYWREGQNVCKSR